MGIHVNHTGAHTRSIKRHPQKLLGCHQIPSGRDHEIDGVAARIDRSIQIGPVAPNPNRCLVDSPGAARTTQVSTNSFVQFRGIARDPARDSGMIHAESPLRHQLLYITVAQGIAQIPADTQRGSLHQQNGAHLRSSAGRCTSGFRPSRFAWNGLRQSRLHASA